MCAVDLSLFSEPLEEWRRRVRIKVNVSTQMIRQDAWQILRQPAAGNMSKPFDVTCFQRFQTGLLQLRGVATLLPVFVPHQGAWSWGHPNH